MITAEAGRALPDSLPAHAVPAPAARSRGAQPQACPVCGGAMVIDLVYAHVVRCGDCGCVIMPGAWD